MTRKLVFILTAMVVTANFALAQDAVIEQGVNDPTTGKPYPTEKSAKASPEINWQISQARFNSDRVDICAQQYLEDIVFLSSRKSESGNDDWTTANEIDIYAFASDGNREEVVPFDTFLNSPSEEGPFTFNIDGTVMYFTRNLPAKKKQSKSTGKQETMIIMSCEIDKRGEWGFPEPFAHNSKHHGVGHPALSSDGVELFFISDNPSGYGGYDLYVSVLDPKGGWSEPVNLGPEINTSGDEMFPFLQDDGSLSFASNGHVGVGGFDLYKCSYEGGALGKPTNMGEPVNSRYDDFAMSYREGNNSGYFSSNRPENGGGTNIYSFTATEIEFPEASGIVLNGDTDEPLRAQEVSLINEKGEIVEKGFTDAKGEFKFQLSHGAEAYKVEIDPEGEMSTYTSPEATAADGLDIDYGIITLANNQYATSGVALDAISGEPIAGLKAMMIERTTGETTTSVTDETGNIRFVLEPNLDYDFKFEKDGYFTKSATFSTKAKAASDFGMNEYADLKFEKIVLDEGIRIKNIYFDYMSSFLNKESRESVQVLIDMLMDNPEIKIEIGAHSDQRGEAKFNQWLSERRAKSVRTYLVEAGIDIARVTYKGYGETKLLRTCGGDCTEADYEMNRRTEFKVVEP